ncbi:Y4MH-like protein [Mya arenaria]|uniref:Y4MH-like protein n=1 Tax=Mya arenaria TaxID=6604 RepID=A0ABY7DPU3_MYAAR|nr:Y4MH-like protein [Mya arenaria]
MEYVDCHFHVWALEKFKYPWPTPDMRIHKDYWPCGLEGNIENTPVKHAVFVQCLNASSGGTAETEWVMDMATRHPVIVGVVAGLDLTSSNLDSVITSLKAKGCLKGARHILDLDADDWITRDNVSNGLETLAKHDLTFDLLVRPHHLPLVPTVVAKHPSLRFIIDHTAKPIFSEGRTTGWWDDMAQIAKFPNVFCKISGLISEQKEDTWRSIDYQPFIDHLLSVFGVDRCVFGSDWPVFENVGVTYKENLAHTEKLLAKLDQNDRLKIFRENAIRFYKLNL